MKKHDQTCPVSVLSPGERGEAALYCFYSGDPMRPWHLPCAHTDNAACGELIITWRDPAWNYLEPSVRYICIKGMRVRCLHAHDVEILPKTDYYSSNM